MPSITDFIPIQPSPHTTLGMLGGGQLGRMFSIAAQQLGYRVCVLAPEANAPAASVCHQHIQADYLDEAALKLFADSVSVVTLEFENIPTQALAYLESRLPVYPQQTVLAITQHRIREKSFLKDQGFPVTPFHPVRSFEDLEAGLAVLGYPAILKTAGFGYDGKGQVKIQSPETARQGYESMNGQEAILEQFIPFTKEFSVIAARNPQGDLAVYPPFENRHRNHILDITVCPATLPESVTVRALELSRQILTALNAIGVVCIEFFLVEDGSVLINELAPRPHNSGHLTIEAMTTSQFEQQVRAICGLPLGPTDMRQPAAMANLLGDRWEHGEPDWVRMWKDFPEVKLHLYGKGEARAGRKMGHLTAWGSTAAQAAQCVSDARDSLN